MSINPILKLLPEAEQLQNRSSVLKDKDRFNIKTLAEIFVWASPKMCNSKEEFLRKGEDATTGGVFFQLPSAYQDELIVLHTFQEKLSDDEVSLGILFTNRRLFRNLLFAREGHRHHGIVVSVDGTYRLHHGGWTLVPFGTVGVIYDSRHGYSHRFFPIAYLFVRSETTKSYDEDIRNKCVDFLGWSLKVQFGTLDHADCIAAAFKMNWPNIVLLSC
eukprot:jgi/Phyca11/101126/e_gw1.5.410.1